MSLGLAIAATLAPLAAAVAWRVGKRSAEAENVRLASRLRAKEDELKRVRHELAATHKAEARVKEPAPVSTAHAELEARIEELRAVVAPLAAQARVEAALTSLPASYQHRGHLTSLLEVITARASFGGAVLSDEVGLTVADTGVEGADAIAAAASMLLTLADRLSTSGQPAPVGFVARDGEGHLVLHRIFTAGEQRYVLTAVAKSGALGPDTLDPVLPELRRILAADTAGDAR